LARDTVETAFRGRRHKPVFMVDLAVPRDIETGVKELDDIYLYSVDDLQHVIEENRAGRAQAAADAEEIIDARAQMFIEQLQALDAVPLIRDMRELGNTERDRALEQAQRKLASGQPAEEVMQWLANTLANRLLHRPTAGLRDAAANGDAASVEIGRTSWRERGAASAGPAWL